MRVTLSIDDEILQRVRALAASTGRPIRAVVNELLRAGLTQLELSTKEPVRRSGAKPMGLRAGVSLENVQELIATIEGEDAR